MLIIEKWIMIVSHKGKGRSIYQNRYRLIAIRARPAADVTSNFGALLKVL